MRRASPAACYLKDARGATALEFALIGPLFLLLVYGIIEFGLELLTQLDLDNATQAAARQIEVGSATTAATFTSDVCASASVLLASCSTKLQVYVTSGASFSGLTAATVSSAGVLSPATYTPGSSGQAVLVQVAYVRPYDVKWFTSLFGGTPALLSSVAVLSEPS